MLNSLRKIFHAQDQGVSVVFCNCWEKSEPPQKNPLVQSSGTKDQTQVALYMYVPNIPVN